MSDDDQLFDGIEEPLEGSDTVDAEEAVKDLSYDEVHAASLGWFLMFATQFLWLTSNPLWYAFCGVFSLLAFSIVVGRCWKPVGYVVREPHYYIISAVIGGVMAYIPYLLWLS